MKLLLTLVLLLVPTIGFTKNAETCLAKNIFFEARQEGPDGRLAIGDVVMNRKADPRWPNTVCGVVYQKHQFSWVNDNLSNNPEDFTAPADELAWKRAKELAHEVLTGERLGITSTFYHTVSVNPSWSRVYTLDGKIGRHVFYSNETKHR